MDSNNLNEAPNYTGRPVIARQKGKLGAVMIDPKTGKPIPGTWIPKSQVPEKALKYLDPAKFAAAEKRNTDRQAQIDAEKQRLKDVGNPPDTRDARPKQNQKPATASTPTPRPAPKPAAVPFSKSVSAPSTTDLDKYKINKDWAAANPRLAQAQVARASGQSRADINKILYKPGTAAYGASGQSEMEKQVAQMRQDREKMAKQRDLEQTGPRAQSKLPGSPYSPVATSKMSDRTKNILGVKEQYDAYDLVLEYLFSQGHVGTVDEAHYVMMQMDSEYIQNIIESPGEWFRGIFNPNNSAASKAQNTSPFAKPTKPLPSIISPFSKPASRTDSGTLTTYGAGGGAAAERAGQTRDQVMRQGALNQEKQNKPKANPGPNFGR